MIAERGAALSLMRDGAGRPKLSATFIVARAPGVQERLSDLVEHVTLTAEVQVQLGSGAPRSVSVEVVGHPSTWRWIDGPFGVTALNLNLSGEEASALLTAIIRGEGGPMLHADIHLLDGDISIDAALGELLGAESGGDPLWLRIATLGPEGLVDIPPVRRPRGQSSTLNGLTLVSAAQAMPLQAAIRPQLDRPQAFVALKPHLLDRIHLQTLVPLAPVPTTDGPVINDVDGLLRDRSHPSRRWFVPSFVFDPPARGDAAEDATFSFRVAGEGHTTDGREAIEATISLTLRETMSDAAQKAAADIDPEHVEPVPLEDLRVRLGIPFRDPGTEERIEYHPAESVDRSNGLLRVTFALRDQWARMAYGALSTPGFQSRPPHLVVAATYRGWREETTAGVVGGRKAIGLAGAMGKIQRPAIAQLAENRLTVLGNATLLDASRLTPLLKRHWVAAQATVTLPALEVFVDCRTSGDLYRSNSDGTDVALGCQPAFSLGQGDPRTHEEVEVSAAAGHATVLRSLTRPRRFLLVPKSYCVGRYGPGNGSRSYTPTLLLHSAIDVDDPSNIRCVLSAGLQPDLPPHVRAAIVHELASAEAAPVHVELPWDAGLSPTLSWAVPSNVQVEAVPTDTGFAAILSTDVPGFLTLQSLLRTSGVSGRASYTLPDGAELSCALRLLLDRVVGPWESGIIHITGSGLSRRLENMLDRRVAVGEIRSGNRVLADVDHVLGPREDIDVTLSEDASEPVVVARQEPGVETLEELRAYVEDLDLGVVVVASQSIPAGTSMSVRLALVGDEDVRDVTLNASRRQQEVVFTLPLTRYLTDPALTVTVETPSATPITFAWSIRDQGVLIPIHIEES